MLPASGIAYKAAQPNLAPFQVRIGSLGDPDDLPGLAHFTEHMLFYASEKYPLEDDYSKFVVGSQNQAVPVKCLYHTTELLRNLSAASITPDSSLARSQKMEAQQTPTPQPSQQTIISTSTKSTWSQLWTALLSSSYAPQSPRMELSGRSTLLIQSKQNWQWQSICPTAIWLANSVPTWPHST